MDRLDRKAEIEYEAFRKNFRIEFAEKWCKDNRITFEYVFKKNE